MCRSIPPVQEFINTYIGQKVSVYEYLDPYFIENTTVVASSLRNSSPELRRKSKISENPLTVTITEAYLTDAGLELSGVTRDGAQYTVYHCSTDPALKKYLDSHLNKKIKVYKLDEFKSEAITVSTYDSYTENMKRWTSVTKEPMYVTVVNVWFSDAGLHFEGVTSSGDKYVVEHNSNLPLEYVRAVSKINK